MIPLEIIIRAEIWEGGDTSEKKPDGDETVFKWAPRLVKPISKKDTVNGKVINQIVCFNCD